MVLDYFYQTVGFHFYVSFRGGIESLDARFQSVSGLDVQLETESIKEGGENRFEHQIPVRRKYSDLVLKRGLISPDHASLLTDWCKNAFETMQVEPCDLQIHLLNEKHVSIMHWNVVHAWPKAWKFGELNAEKSEILIETLELRYNRFEFKGLK